jgi:WD40 repeat protein
VSRSDYGTARQWDVENGETVLAPVETGNTDVYAVVYSPDMTLIVTCEHDKFGSDTDSVRIWDVQTGEIAATLQIQFHAMPDLDKGWKDTCF